MAASGLFNARFKDDWVVLAPTRWKLRKAIAIVNQMLAELRGVQHTNKTFTGESVGVLISWATGYHWTRSRWRPRRS